MIVALICLQSFIIAILVWFSLVFAADGDSGEEDDDANLKNVAQTKRRIAKRKNEAGETPLHIAAKKGDLNGVRKCMKMVCALIIQ